VRRRRRRAGRRHARAEYRRDIRRLPVITLLLAAASAFAPSAFARPFAGGPHRPTFDVVLVEGMSPAQLHSLARRGAVGLLVPGSGSLTDRRSALASLVRGADVNPYIRGRIAGRPVLSVVHRDAPPLRPYTIVVALPPGGRLRSNDRRFPIAVLGGGFHGILTSPTTRIPGLVSIVDVAPTALGRARGALSSLRSTTPIADLHRLDGRIHANNRLKLPTLIIVACALLLLAAVRPRVGVPAVLAALATSLVAGAANVTSEPLLVAMVVVGTLGGGLALARACRSEGRLLVAILAVMAAYLVLLVLHPDWVAITPLGPTQNSRFWGIGNQLETLLLAPVLVGAAIAGRRWGVPGFAAFAVLSLVLVTDNRLGSDGGGAMVFGVALAFVGARVLRIGARGFAVLLACFGALALGIVLLDLGSPGPDHLRSAFAHGVPGLLAVAANRVPLAYAPALRQWVILVPVALSFAAAFALALRLSRRRGADLVLGAGLAILASLLVNDSAPYELTAGVAVLAALARFGLPAQPPAGAGLRTRRGV